jgi:hypothetical protein
MIPAVHAQDLTDFVPHSTETSGIETLPTAPVTCNSTNKGRVYFDTATNRLLVCSGTEYVVSSDDRNRVVYVDSTRPTKSGEVYATLATAITYINTQTPGSSNPWAIFLQPGTNSESVTIPTHTVLVGEHRTKHTLSGTITLSTGAGVQNVTVSGNLNIAGGNTGHVTNSDVILGNGGGGGIAGTLTVHGSLVDGSLAGTAIVTAMSSHLGVSSLVNAGILNTYNSNVFNFSGAGAWNNFGVAYNNQVLSAANRLGAANTQAAIDELILGTPADNFTLDENQSIGQDVTLTFGNIVLETLKWDEAQDYFILSDSLVVDGNINLQGTTLRLDSDESGNPDQDLEIIAEQGSEADGIIRYDDGNNRWELSNNGGPFAAISTGSGSSGADLSALQVKRTTDLILTTSFVDVTFNVTDFENQPSVVQHNNTNTDNIDIFSDGVYQIMYRTQIQASAGSALVRAFSRVRLNDSTVVSGSSSEIDVWYDSAHILTGSVVVSLTSGDFVTLQLSREASALTATAISETVFYVVKLNGVEGPQGPAGSSGDFEDVYAEDVDKVLSTSGGNFSISTGAGTFSVTGISNFNLNNNTATNINTGTSTGAISLGGGSGAIGVNSSSWDISTAGVASGFTGITSTGSISLGNNSGTVVFDGSNFDVTSAGVVTLTGNLNLSNDSNEGITGGGLVSCSASNQSLQWNSTTNKFSCTTAGNDTATFNDATADNAVSYTSATDVWDGTHPNITTSSTSSTVLVSVVIQVRSDDNSDEQAAFRITRETNGTDPTCTDPQVGIDLWGSFITSSNQEQGISATFLDSPGVAGTVRYGICTSDSGLNDGNVLNIQMTLVEMGN